jgi:multidrug efflux pump subunit AcrA (membrane-fusion protein)
MAVDYTCFQLQRNRRELTPTMKKKKKKGKIILVVVLLVCIIAIAAGIFSFTHKSTSVETTTVQKGDISTYHTFSGTADAVFAEDCVAQSIDTVYRIYVENGDSVERGDKLLKTDDGVVYKAGVSGTVAGLTVSEGDAIASGQNLLSVINYDSFQTVLKVDEYDVTSIRVGQEVQVTVNSLGAVTTGTVSKISERATVSGGISYFTVTVSLPSVSGLRIGMSLEAKFLKAQATDVPLLDINALHFDSSNNAYVLIPSSDGKTSTQKAVTIGIEDGKKVQIISGLSVGEKVELSSSTSTTTATFAPTTTSQTSSSTVTS